MGAMAGTSAAWWSGGEAEAWGPARLRMRWEPGHPRQPRPQPLRHRAAALALLQLRRSARGQIMYAEKRLIQLEGWEPGSPSSTALAVQGPVVDGAAATCKGGSVARCRGPWELL